MAWWHFVLAAAIIPQAGVCVTVIDEVYGNLV